jgi:hypothetical protein
MLKCWPKKQRMEMVRKWAERAERGDLEAGKLLMAYTYGKPTERHEHSGSEGEPLEIIVKHVRRDGTTNRG